MTLIKVDDIYYFKFIRGRFLGESKTDHASVALVNLCTSLNTMYCGGEPELTVY